MKGKFMKTTILSGVATLIAVLVVGCAGKNANINNLSAGESRTIHQQLNDNWSDYEISYNMVVLVFKPKDNDKKILVPKEWHTGGWGTVKDQETWTQIVSGTKTMPHGWRTNQVWGNPIREIWANDQFYGYISHEQRELISAQIVDENTVRIFHHNSGDWRL